MKKLIICLMALVFATPLLAQNKGDMYIGGTFGIVNSTQITNGSSVNAFGTALEPEFSYFVTDKFSIGASVGYALETANRTDPVSHTITITPKMTYYAKLAENFYYTPTLQLGFACGIWGKTSMSDTMVMPGFGLDLAIGSFEFRPTQKIGLSFNVLGLSYVFLSYKYKEFPYYELNSSQIGFKLGGTTSVGFKYYF